MTVRLPVHLEDQQLIYFDENEDLNDKLNNKMHETPLTHFLKLNETNNDVRDIYYYQMQNYYRWDLKLKLWTKRQR